MSGGLAMGASPSPPKASLGVEIGLSSGHSSLCLRLTEGTPTTPALHLAFTAESRQQVQEFHRAALAAGAKDNGAPGIRPQYSGQYYAAFVVGPDGHNIEVVCHERDA